jgi:hypothetical protein
MAIWFALAAYLACLAAGLAFVAYRAICAWRRVKRTGAAFTAELDRIARVTGEIEEQQVRANAAVERLADAQQQLRVSRARLDVQLAAVREARAQVARVLWFVPGT